MLKKIVYSFFEFLFRKRDPVAVSIRVIVACIVTIAAGIAGEDALSALAETAKARYDSSPFVYWIISILQAYFSGGDWVLLSVLIFVLLILAIVKVKSSKGNPRHLLTSRIRHIEILIEEFKTSSAFSLAEGLLKEIDDTEMDPSAEASLKAKVNFLLGQSASQDSGMAANYFLESYRLAPDEVKYKERAATTIFFKGNEVLALQMAEEILAVQPMNERAHALRALLNPAFSLATVPQSVANTPIFKRIYAVMFLHKNKQSTLDFLFERELREKPVPETLTFDNMEYWILLSQINFFQFRQRNPIMDTFTVTIYPKDEQLLYANSLLKRINSKVVNTEFYQTTSRYSLMSFRYFHSLYLLYGSKESVNEMRKVFAGCIDKLAKEEIFFQDLLVALLQIDDNQAVIDITNSLSTQTTMTLAFRFRAYTNLRRIPEALENAKQYISTFKEVDAIEMYNVVSILEVVIHTKGDAFQYYQDNIKDKIFSNPIFEKIAWTYAARLKEDQAAVVDENLNYLTGIYQTIPLGQRTAVLISLADRGQLSKCNELIGKYHDWKNEPIPLFLLTDNLIKQKENSDQLLEVLKYRRTHFPEKRFLLQELNLHIMLQNFEEVLAVSTLGKSSFADDLNFQYFYIMALYRLGRNHALDGELNNDIVNVDFHPEHKFFISKICIERGKVDLGLEIFYRVTKGELDNPSYKERFFVLVAMLGEKEQKRPQPETVVVNSVVKVATQGETKFFEITKDLARSHWISKNLVGKSVGDHLKLDDPFIPGKEIELTVIAVFDKYFGLAAEIADEVGQSGLTGMSLRSVKYEGPSPENLEKALVDNFGHAGDQAKLRTEEAMEKYYRREISFTELVRRVSAENPLEIYSYLTSPASSGFVVTPLPYINQISNVELPAPVIDLTSLIIVAKLSADFPSVKFPKFGISQYLINHLNDELADARALPDEGISVSVTSAGVRPTLLPPDYKKRRVETFERLVAWATSNCEVRYSSKKLDILREHPELLRGDDWYYNYLLDTVFISVGSVLLSDDAWFAVSFPNHYSVISTEAFLKQFDPEQMKKDFIPVLIANHYHGIRVTKADLERELKKLASGPKSTFTYCLDNLSFSAAHDPTIVDDCLEFIKIIYADNYPPEFKKDLAQKVFVNMLRGYPDMPLFRTNIKKVINAKFHLLQNHIPSVIADLNGALVILGLSPIR